VRKIEATAFVSPRAVPSMADAKEIAALLWQWPSIQWSALVPNARGARDAIAAGMRRLEYVVSAADSHSLANVGRPTGQATEAVAEVADMIGTTVPARVTELVTAVRQVAQGKELGVHFHNTRGSGLASAWAAIEAGVTQLDASAGGLGGCPFAVGQIERELQHAHRGQLRRRDPRPSLPGIPPGEVLVVPQAVEPVPAPTSPSSRPGCWPALSARAVPGPRPPGRGRIDISHSSWLSRDSHVPARLALGVAAVGQIPRFPTESRRAPGFR
jgi:hypothetical protein